MTRKRRIFRGLFFATILGGATYGGYRLLEVRNLSGEWTGSVSESRELGSIEWMTEIWLWKEEGTWKGSFLFRDQRQRWQPCAGGLELQSRNGREYVFREHPSTCAPGGTVRVKRTWSGMQAWRQTPGSVPGGTGTLRRDDLADLPRLRVRGTEPAIRMGQTVRGELTRPSPDSRAMGWIDTYRYLGEPGVPVVIVVRSDEFEPSLMWRAQMGGRWFEPADTGLVSRPAPNELRVTVEPDGRGAYHGITVYTLRSKHFRYEGPRETTYGKYTLSVEPAPGAIGWADPDSLPLVRAGDPVRGALREAEQAAKGHGGYYYADYLYRGRAGEALTVEVRSDSLDPFVQIGRMRPGGLFIPLAQNDNASADDGDAVATLTLPDDGPYVLRASVNGWQNEGSFTLRVTRR